MGAQAEVSITPAPPHPEPCGNLPAQLWLFISRAVAAKGMYLAPNYKQFGGCKGIALPLLQYCICAGCSTYTCLSRQVPGFLLHQKGTFSFDSCCLLPSLAHSEHLFSCSNRESNFAGEPIPEIQNSTSEILQE